MCKVKFKTDEHKNRYPYIEMGREEHGRPRYRIWVSGKLLEKEGEGYFITFPKRGATITRTEKGNLVMRPTEDSIIYDVGVDAPRRGQSDQGVNL